MNAYEIDSIEELFKDLMYYVDDLGDKEVFAEAIEEIVKCLKEDNE